ncbi:cyclic GMP-AMP phosphodiesterase SMPDL3A [Gouania willdenowi]|uniref:Acid sphingomyelinase-like phosphodiesterase n=1 Tax=Gouania willdenowi TaxID=441366 RepID=A0A8C5E8A5_GOUWI|nr:acid sphingomyelinase-like phosphodiesterase 3a [Gouania willdenowi]
MFVYKLLCLVLILRLRAAAPTGSAHLGDSARFWHITDLHLDPTYHVTSDPREVCSSSKGSPASDAGPFGAFLCDSPYRLIQSAFSHMEPLVQAHDFIIWTGDSPPHVSPEKLSTDAVIQLMKNMTLTFRKHFPNTTVFPSIGNHDYWPQDQLPAFTNQIYRAAAELWRDWLKDDALLTLAEGGFYSQLVKPGLRLLSVNTILYYGPNKAVGNGSDPAGQFLWLEKTLAGAAQRLEKVFIIGHVPVGFLPYARNTTAIREEHNERLLSIYRKYSDVITGQFYGHTHRDSVMVLLNHQGKAVNSLFVSPAVTPIKDAKDPFSNNPGLRLYVYDPQDYGVMDIWQYYLNLTEANERRRSDWRLEYVMTEAFGLSDLRPQSLLKLGLELMTPHSDAFLTYFRHFMVGYDSSFTCEGPCWLNQVCAVLYLDQDAYAHCVANEQLWR